jgi:diacylglycerol kinase family enzyme
MRHLFIVNPKARLLKGRTEDIVREIRIFFGNYPQIKYSLHVTRWKRDAVGFTRRYVSGAEEIVRVYAVGGMGTLFEVINGVIGMPNVQIASWPFGLDNSFLYYFGADRMELFRSLRNLVFSRVAAFDLIRCGNNYGICSGFMGLEARAALDGDRLIDSVNFTIPWSVRALHPGGFYMAAAIYHGLKKDRAQSYHVMIDGMPVHGIYTSILVANQPYYSKKMRPAMEAEPDDGILDIYLTRPVPRIKFFRIAADYAQGRYYKWPNSISHFRGKGISVSSDQMMTICIDGEIFFDASIEYEAIPRAVDFVCPGAGPSSAGLSIKTRSSIGT